MNPTPLASNSSLPQVFCPLYPPPPPPPPPSHPPQPPHAIPPPNPYFSCYPYYFDSGNAAHTNVFVPPYPPPGFSINQQLLKPMQDNVVKNHCETLSHYNNLHVGSTGVTSDFSAANSLCLQNTELLDDDAWLSKWLAEVKGKRIAPVINERVKIHETRLKLKKINFLLKKLNVLKDTMENGFEELNSPQWNTLCCEFLEAQKEVTGCISELPNIEVLKKQVAKRAKKRERQRRRSMQRKDQRILDIERRRQLHHQIDNWMKNMQEAIDYNKREESLKKEADSVLSEVLRKKADGRRQLALVTALLKLRQLRAKSASNRGQYISIENGIKFLKVAENLKALWEKQLKEYDVEENGMRVMLSEAVDERDQSQVLRDRQIFSEWNKLLFGNKCNIPEFFLRANENVESFITIRQSWDKFIVSNEASVQSNIPVGWVLPSNPSSPNWEKLLQSEKTDTC